MLDKLKELIGDELFAQVQAKLGDKEYFFAEGKDFIPISKFNEINEVNKSLNAQLKERDTQLTELQKAVQGNEELTKQITALQESNKQNQEKYDAQVLKLKKDNALRIKLIESGAKNADALYGMIYKDIDDLKFENDSYVGLDEKIAKIKKDNEWLFTNTTPNAIGANHTSGAEGGGDEFADFRKI